MNLGKHLQHVLLKPSPIFAVKEAQTLGKMKKGERERRKQNKSNLQIWRCRSCIRSTVAPPLPRSRRRRRCCSPFVNVSEDEGFFSNRRGGEREVRAVMERMEVGGGEEVTHESSGSYPFTPHFHRRGGCQVDGCFRRNLRGSSEKRGEVGKKQFSNAWRP